jgi:hypothetical protein
MNTRWCFCGGFAFPFAKSQGCDPFFSARPSQYYRTYVTGTNPPNSLAIFQVKIIASVSTSC